MQRVKIALSAAKGLEFLHLKADPTVIHTNIKSSKILIFDDDVAKIGDIGVSRKLIHNRDEYYNEYYNTYEMRNFGHEAPEYATKCFHALRFLHYAWKMICILLIMRSSLFELVRCASFTGEYSTKSDVYCFGVVLLELLTGRKPHDHTLPRGQHSLVTWATPRLSEDKVEQCIDPRLGLGGGYPAKAVAKMAAVAALCVQYEADFRPEMSIVVKALSPLLKL
ncbi:unnamed protein product [Urochloa humidicola]